MRKFISFVMILVVLFVSTSCVSSKAPETEVAEIEAPEEVPAQGAVIAECISATASIDDRSFCQGAWEGIKAFGDENGLPYAYYQATGDSTTDLVNCIGVAVDGGAEIVVVPGFAWGAPVFLAQDLYPDTKLVILDGDPHSEDYSEYRQEDNVYSIYYAEQESGFLAGYAAVKEGFTNMGFIGGMAVPPVVRFGYGFVAGAEYAAQEMGLEEGSITMYYHYLGNFDVSPENQTYAASWFSSGIDIIFAAAGDVTSVVSSAASQTGEGKWVIGVDVNQGWDADNVLTSATKNLRGSTYQALDLYFNGEFPGGQVATLNSSNEGVNIPTDEETWRFSTFTMEEYEAILSKLSADEGGIASSIPVDTGYATADLIPLRYVVVTVY